MIVATVGRINEVEDRGEPITKMLNRQYLPRLEPRQSLDTHLPCSAYCSCSSWYTYCGYVSLSTNVLPGHFKYSSWCAINLFN